MSGGLNRVRVDVEVLLRSPGVDNDCVTRRK
jgi:hypothetical protein